MHRKNNSPNGDERQLNLPFKINDTSIGKVTSQDNIVYLSSKIEENSNRDEKAARKRSLKRLLNYAGKLDW